MKVQDLKSTFQYGMHGCGSYKGTNHVNTLESLQYWLGHGVKVFEIDVAMTNDGKFVALAHKMDAHCLKTVGINPYCDKSNDKFSEAWFMRQRLCEQVTGGLTPMNLDTIINVMRRSPDIIVMFDLWGLWDINKAATFSECITEKATDDILDRCILEVYNKKMLAGIRGVNLKLHVMYCIHGSSAVEFDESVNPSALREMGIDIISFPWVCTKDYPGEMEQYHKEGFTIFSLSSDNRHKCEKQNAGVNVNLVDVIKTPKYYIKALCKRFQYLIRKPKLSNMHEMTIEEAHAVALEMMKEVHEFCMNNNIQYSLAYGSLLGAIRHKGFIPWDDDIDIWMTRPNFEKFTKTFKSKKGFRHLSIYDKDSLLCFDRVYEIDHTYVKNMTKACDNETGIWIDVMLLDLVPDDVCLRDKQYSEFVELNKKINLFKGCYTLKELHRYKSLLKTYIYCLIKGKACYLKKNTALNVQKEQLNVINKYNNTPSSNYCFFQCGVMYRNEPQELLPVTSFERYQLSKFEDTEFMIVQDYDKVLTLLFGDYMTPPPANQQVKSHGICFWK